MPSCRKEEGGKPACALGLQVNHVQLRGIPLSAIKQYRDHGIKDVKLKDSYELFIVLENPDPSDDQSGMIGHAKNLEKIESFVTKAGFSLDDVFITYLTKCLTPRRRKKPTTQEIIACSGHTREEIKRYNPKTIILLGNSPLKLFNITGGGVIKLRGNEYNLPLPHEDPEEKYRVIVSLDPSILYYRYDPQLERRLLSDYVKAKNPETQGPPDVEFTLIDSIDKLKEFSRSITKGFAFDTESRSLPWSREPLLCLSFAHSGGTYVLPIRQHDPNGLDWKCKLFWTQKDLATINLVLKEIFENPDTIKCGWNIKYDLLVLRKHLGIELNGFLFDGMCAHHLLNESPPHDLEYVSDIEFGIGNYSAAIHDIVGRGKLTKPYDTIPDDILWPYSAADAFYTYKLCLLFMGRLKKASHLWNLYNKETYPLIRILADAEWFGNKIDKETLNNLVISYENEKNELYNKIVDATWKDFNPNSPDEVCKAIIKLGYEDTIRDKNKAKGYTADKEKLGELKKELPLAGHILDYRNKTKIISTYLQDALTNIDSDGRVRYSFLIHGTTSGRLSCRFLHQIPRSDKQRKYNMRDMFVEEDGYTMLYFDFSQIELHVLAIRSKDAKILKILKDPKGDIHKATAGAFLGIPDKEVSEYNRQYLGKSSNFGIIYGSKGFNLVKTCTWEDEEGKRWPITWDMFNRGHERFARRFPRAAEYAEEVADEARMNNGILVTPFGRERRLGGKLNDSKDWIREAAEREGVNFSIQSPASSVTVRAIININDYVYSLIRSGAIRFGDIRLVNTIHDAGLYGVRKDLMGEFKSKVKEIAESPVSELDNHCFRASIGTGQNWAEAERNSK